MYSVLIVDDELAIREGLRSLLDWAALGFRVVDTAANAIEAKQKYELYSPDLMIIDIRMPGKDGLELIEELHAGNPQQHIIILSGFADFSYAKRALAFGIDCYLLKPVDEDELQLYLVKLAGELMQRNASHRKKDAVKEWSREMLVQSALLENNNQAHASLELSVIESGLIWDSYQIVLIKLLLQDYADCGPSTAVKARLAKSFEDHDRGIIFSMDSYLGILFQPSFQKELVRKLMYQDVQEAVTAQGLECIITAGDTVDSFDHLSRSYHSALARMMDHFFYEESGIIGPDSLKLKELLPVSTKELETKLEAVTDRLYFAMDVGNTEVLAALIREAGAIMIAAGLSEMAIKSRYVRIVTCLFNKLSIQYRQLESGNNLLEDQVQQIYKHISLPVLQRYIIQLLHHNVSEINRDDMDILMKRMLDFINRHYSENLKLEALADVFNYSSAYLGKLFKIISGYSFNTYLDKVRIEKAKELLSEGCKIHQAAKEAGFSDVDYFREKFKKYEGISPSVYRKK